MKLTKDDFGEADSVWIIIKKPLSQFKEVRDQILKNQEKAERWDKLEGEPFDLYLIHEYNKKIVEALKKEIKEDTRFCHSLAINYRHYEVLKKILKAEK